MDKKEWEKTIKAAMAENGLDKPGFSLVVESLAEILAQRDKAFEEYINDGGKPCIIKTSDRGAKNIAKNPQLLVWLDLNNLALQYWRECCLSPAALRKISAEIFTRAGNDFDAIIAALFEKEQE